MVEGEIPRPCRSCCGQVDVALRRGRAEGRPAGLFTHNSAEAILRCGLLAFLANDKGLGRFDHHRGGLRYPWRTSAAPPESNSSGALRSCRPVVQEVEPWW